MTSALRLRRCLAGIAAPVLGALMLAGCSSSGSSPAANTVSSAASKASSAASSALSSIAGQAGTAASQAAASASSAASSALGQVKDGVNAVADVVAGPVAIASDGHAETQLKITNPTPDDRDYVISVNFEDPSGNLLDVTVVTVSKVPANSSANASAKSNRQLSGTVQAKVTAAVRH